MADTTAAATTNPAPRKRFGWLRVLLWIVVIIIVLLVVIYFVVTSSAFLQKQILPRVSKSINADVTVSSAEIHPFSLVVLHDLKVQPTNQPPIFTAPEVRLKYSLWDIIGGNIHVDEAIVTSPVIQVVENPDGTSNLDPLTKSQKPSAEKKEKPASNKPSKPMKIDIRKVTLAHASILKVQNHRVGTRDLVEITNLDVTLTGLKNGESGKLEIAAILRDENNPPAPAMYGLLQAKVDGSFNFSLSDDLKPTQVLGDAHLDISQAGGSFNDFQGLAGLLHCDVTATDIKEVSLTFSKEDTRLGELRASGPYDAQKSEGKLSVQLLSVDKQVLNLFGAKLGYDFGSTQITLTNQIDLTKSGAAIAVVGELSATKFQLSRTNESFPPLDLRADYNVAIDQTEKTALLRTLDVDGQQNGRGLLHGQLTSPMTVAWGNQTNAVGDSAFSLAVTKLNLADWKMFLGNLAPAGTLNMNLKLLSQQAGKRLTFDVTNQIQGLTATVGSTRLDHATVTVKANGQVTDMKQYNLGNYSFMLAQSNHTALTVSGSGTYDQGSSNADLQVDLETSIPRTLELLGQTNMAASSGMAQLKAHVTQKQDTRTVNGTLALTNFTAKIGADELRNFSTAMELDVNQTPEQIEIRKANGSLSEDRKPGGSFDVSGTYSLTNKPSQLTVKLTGLNENGLRPFLAPMLTGKKLVSVSLDGTASAERGANGDMSAKADLSVTNLVVSDPAQKLPATPLQAKVQLDASVAKQVADVRQLQLTLTPTDRAKNEFSLKGHVDMSKTNAITGQLTLSSGSLDLTSYYDLFAGTNSASKAVAKNTSKQPAAAPAQPAPTAAATTNQLPFRNFTVDANVRAFYLREIAGTNFQMSLKLDGSHVVLKPFGLTLNGSPMLATVDADLSVPGYKWAVTFNATNVPFAPLWNTFEPTDKGEVAGTLSANLDMNGTGTGGESLQKTLKGSFNIGTTNLNLDVTKTHSRIIRDIAGVVVKALEMLKSGGTGEVSKTPVDIITARGAAGDGRVTVEQALVRSAVFHADVTNGTVTLEPVLTNSTINLPISIWVSQRIPLVGAIATETNAGYAKLPDFYVEKGTVGDPKPSLNMGALTKQVIKEFIPGLGGGGGTNGGSGNLLNNLGGLLNRGGNTANTNQPATTNQPPATNQSPVNNLLNRFLK